MKKLITVIALLCTSALSANEIRPIEARIGLVRDTIDKMVRDIQDKEDNIPFDHTDYKGAYSKYSQIVEDALVEYERNLETVLVGFEPFFQVLNSDFYTPEQKYEILSGDQDHFDDIKREAFHKFYLAVSKVMDASTMSILKIRHDLFPTKRSGRIKSIKIGRKKYDIPEMNFDVYGNGIIGSYSLRYSEKYPRGKYTWQSGAVLTVFDKGWSVEKKHLSRKMDELGCQSRICLTMIKADMKTIIQRLMGLVKPIDIPMGRYSFSLLSVHRNAYESIKAMPAHLDSCTEEGVISNYTWQKFLMTPFYHPNIKERECRGSSIKLSEEKISERRAAPYWLILDEYFKN